MPKFPRQQPYPTRTAVIMEMSDGTTMLFNVASDVQITIDTEGEYGRSIWDDMVYLYSTHTTIELSGTLLEGKVWNPGDAVFTQQQALPEPDRAIES